MQPVNSKAATTQVAVAKSSSSNDTTTSYADSTTTSTDSLKTAPFVAKNATVDTVESVSQKQLRNLQEQLSKTNKRVDSLLAYQNMKAAPAPLTVTTELEKGEDKTFFENSGKVQVFFETNSSELNSRSKEKLDDMIRYAELHPETNFWVKGYTDQTGSARYNEILSKKRASAVQEYLQTNGIDQKRLNLVSLGQDNTVSSGSQAYGRRVEVELY